MRKSVFTYDCEKYSIKDIDNFISQKGYKVDFFPEDYNKYKVVHLNLIINLPDPERLKNAELWKRHGPPSIHWQPFNELYSQRNRAIESGDPQRIKEATAAYDAWHKEASKLYNQLKRKFGIKGIKTLYDVEEAIKKGEYPMSIKDLDYIEELRKNGQKKPWQFWKNN